MQKQLFVIGRNNRQVAQVITALKAHGAETREAEDGEPETIPLVADVYITVDDGSWTASALHLLRQPREGKTIVVDFGSGRADELDKYAAGPDHRVYRSIDELRAALSKAGEEDLAA